MADTGMIELAKKTSQFIDGAFVAGEGKVFGVEDPSTEETVAEIAGASIAQVEAAIAAGKRAWPAWGALPRAERVAILRRFVASLAAQSADLRETLIAEGGVPGGTGLMPQGIMGAQVAGPMRQAGECLDLYDLLPDVIDTPIPLANRVNVMGKMVQSVMRYAPVGVVAAIASYNYPFFTAMWKVMPALVTGNAVILRPSPLTPISALIFANAAVEAGLPAGILSVIMEEGLEGAQLLTTHRDVDCVTFTGSTAVGKKVMAQAADTMKRLQLELGGKSAQIFLPDAAMQAAGAAAGVCLAHAGQGCVLGTRIFVPEDQKVAVLEAMKASLDGVKIGSAHDADTVLGPVISAAQVARCEHFVKLAVEDGAKIVLGGKRPEGVARGHFFEATILDTPDNGNAAAQEEIFGPVVSVIGYRDVEHAIEMANDSDYGLSGYVFSNDKRQALEVAARLRTGAVNVNGGGMSSFVSGGGHKLSGIGRERGEEGIRLYQNVTSINIAA